MSESRQDLPSQLEKARQQLKKAQARVAALEAQMSMSHPLPPAVGEDRYQHLLDNMQEGCQIISFDWRYLYLNDAAIVHSHRTKADLIGYTMMECYPGIEHTAMFALLQQCMRDRTVESMENEFTYPDGSRGWFELSIQPIPEGIFVLSFDITKRKQGEQALLESEEKLRLFVEYAPAAIAMLDQNMHYISVSHRWLADYRLSEQNIIGRSHYEVFPDIPEVWKEVHRRCLRGAVEKSEGDPFPRADGSLDWVRWEIHPWRKVNGEIGGILLSSEVITERKQAVEEIQSLAKFPRENINPVLRVTNDGILLHANPGSQPLLTLWGCQVGTPIPEVYQRLIEESLSTGTNRQIEVMCVHTLYVLTIVPIADTNYANIYGYDITERRLAEKELEALYNATSHLFNAEGLLSLGQQIVEGVVKEFNHVDCGLMLVDQEHNHIIRLARTGELNIQPVIPLTLDGKGLVPLAIRTGKAIYVPDVRHDPHYLASTAQTQSELVIPLKTNRGIIAVFDLQSATPAAFSERDQRILTAYAERAAAALESMQLHEALNRHAANLEWQVNVRTAELQEAKERVEGILNNSVAGILLVNHDLIIRQTNPAFDRLFACETDAYFDQPLKTLFHAEAADLIPQIIRKSMVEGQAANIETRARRLNGTEFEAELNIGYIKNNGFVCSIHDITERKAQERQLRYHANLQANISDAVIVTDLDFHIQSWNKAAERIYGWRAEEVMNQPVDDLLYTEFSPPDNLEQSLQQLREQDWWQGEITQRHKDGSIRHMLGSVTLVKDEGGLPLSVIAVNRDITERKAQERLLRYHASLQENVSDAVIVADLAFRVQSWNKAAERIYGWRAEEMIGRVAGEVLQTEYTAPNTRERDIQQLREQGWWQGEITQHHKDGSIRHILGSVTLVKDEHDVPYSIVAVSHDITERKQVEAALHARMEEEHEFQTYLKGLHEITIELMQIDELETFYKRIVELGLARLGFERLAMFLYNEEDGTALGTYGTDTQGNLINESHIQFIPDPNGIMMRSFGRSERFYFEENAPLLVDQHATGVVGWNAASVLWNGTQSLGWLVADNFLSHTPASKPLLDIMGLYALTVGSLLAQKQVQLALRESEARYRLLVETMQGGLVVYDTTGAMTYVNDRFCELLDYPREALLGTKAADYVDTANKEQLATNLTRRQHLESSSYEIVFNRKDGKPISLLISGSPLTGKSGEFSGGFAVITDITPQKQAEERLRQALIKEKELSELKSRFVSMASHEFRTPLATILALTETLDAYRHKMTDDQIAQRIDKIKVQVGHLKDIMEDMLLLARMQARRFEFNPVKLDIDAVCRSILDEFQSQADLTHQIEYICDASLQQVTLDKKLIRQVISNLVSNAIKYSPQAKSIQVSLEQSGKDLVIKVSDQGIGIPEEDIKHLFEPFHRAANVGAISGTGLGLVIAKESVELHGGTIAVESQLGVGTTFVVKVPIQKEKPHDENPGH